MPRTTQQYERIKDERRQEILDAARRVFARKGLAATKMSDLAAAAGVSYGLAYHYFPTKEAVYTAVLEFALEGAAAVTERALHSGGTPWERLLRMTQEMLAGGEGDAEYSLLAVQTGASEAIPAEARRLLARYGELIDRNVIELIRQGQAAGQVVAGDPRLLATVFLATIQGLSLRALDELATDRPRPDAPTVLRLLAPV
jgi:AcrR family transcriptional regulator